MAFATTYMVFDGLDFAFTFYDFSQSGGSRQVSTPSGFLLLGSALPLGLSKGVHRI